MLAEYLDSQHQKKFSSNESKLVSSPLTAQSGKPIHNPLDRWLSNISSGSSKSDSARGNASPSSFFSMNGDTTNHNSQHETKGFVTPPNASDKDQATNSIFVWDLKSEAWLPCIFIPRMLNESLAYSHDDPNTGTPITLFKYGDFSILLFFNGQYSDEKFASEMLSLAANRFSGFCDEYSAAESKSVPAVDLQSNKQIIRENMFLGEPGMDIIFVDREDNTFLLLSQHDLSSNYFHRKTNTTSLNDNMTKGIFGIGHKIKENCERENDAAPFIKSSHHMNKLDCRHKLAAHLPLDVMLAFDDMFDEIGRLGWRKNILNISQLNLDETNHDVNGNRTIELCTYLPQGWVYCRAFKRLELYVLLDTSKFVTISDVTKAVSRVRERLLNDKLL
jgi:hypothetical protein